MSVPPSNRPTVPLSDGLPRGIRECPVCGGLRRRVLHRQRFLDGPLGDGYDVAVCGDCGAGYADGIPSQAELDAYYSERSKYAYHQSGGAESPYDFQRFERIADQVLAHLPSSSARILDVGCATGGLLAVLKRRGCGNLVGVDPSPACAAAARRLHGVEVRTAVLQDLADWSEHFDAVLLVGVLEHVRELMPAVEVVARRLAPGGWLYCAQPDVAAFADCVNAPYQQFSVEHLNFFSDASLNRLLGRCGLAPRQTWRWLVEWRAGIIDSVVSGVYGRATDHRRTVGPSDSLTVLPFDRPTVPPSDTPGPAFDNVTEPALKRYLAKCVEEEAGLIRTINDLVHSQEPILVWGAGTLTRRLLATTDLGRANLAAFVDSNVDVQGRSLAGRTVLAPAQVAGRRETILIGSTAFGREIEDMIRIQLHLTNRVIRLGEPEPRAAE